jgi:hypothetical protein
MEIVQTLSPVASVVALAEEVRNSFATVVARTRGRAFPKRGRTAVTNEYDQGHWKRVLDERRWEGARSLYDYVVPPNETKRIAKIGGKLVRISTHEYYRFRLSEIQRIMEEYAGGANEIVELGSGWGMNLFSLALSGRWAALRGFDVSANGVKATNAAAKHFGLTSVVARELDLTNAKHPSFKEIEGATAFSYLCLEQLKYSTSQVIGNLLGSGVKRVIHVEPTPELFSWWRPADVANRIHLRAHDYQNNLLTELKRRERAGDLRLLAVSRLGFSPRAVNDPTLICWEAA